jgi:hypothetical protein
MRRRRTASFQSWSLWETILLAAGRRARSEVVTPSLVALRRVALSRREAFSQAILAEPELLELPAELVMCLDVVVVVVSVVPVVPVVPVVSVIPVLVLTWA